MTVTSMSWCGGIRKMAPSFEEHGLVSANMAEKVADYLAAGAAWRSSLTRAGARQPSTAHRPGREPQVLTEADTLDGGEVVPGWQMPVRGILA